MDHIYPVISFPENPYEGGYIVGEFSSDESGTSVSLSPDGQTVAIGAPLNNSTYSPLDAGHARVYRSANAGSFVMPGENVSITANYSAVT